MLRVVNDLAARGYEAQTIDLLTGVLHAWTKVRVARLTPRLTLLRQRLLRMQQLLRRPMPLHRLPAAKHTCSAQKSQPEWVGFFYARRKAGRWGAAYFGLSKLT